jgi:hypothetical protein
MIGNPIGGLYFGLDVKACSTVCRIGRILENLSSVSPLHNRYGAQRHAGEERSCRTFVAR